MRRPDRDPHARERGFALIAVVLIMMMLMGMAVAVHTTEIGETLQQGAHAVSTAGFYAAEAGINRGMGDYRNIFLSYREPTGAELGSQVLRLGPRTVRYTLTKDCGGGTCAPPNWPISSRVPAGRPFAGLNSDLYKYVATATSELRTGDIETSLGTEFDVNYIPLFQFLAFYQRDLEINPGPTMTLNGPIFTNGDLYMSPGNTLTIADAPPGIPTVSIGAHGSIFRGRKDDQNSPRCNGTLNIDVLADANHDGSLDPRIMPCGSSSVATNQTDPMLAPWLGAIRAHQPLVSVPPASTLHRGPGNDAWDKSDLRIALVDDARIGGYDQIAVLSSADIIDPTLTGRLHAFMTANPGRVFYNDVPNNGCDNRAYGTENCSVNLPAPAGDSYCNRNCYAPAFANHADVYACALAGLPNTITPCAGANTMSAAVTSLIQLGGGQVTQRRGGFYNNRERAWVRMLNVNLHDLLVWNRAQAVGSRLIADPDDTTEAGLVIYLTVKGQFSATAPGALGRERYGVRVFGSRNLDFPPMANPTGVTVVSDQAIYVEGDYNVLSTQPRYDATHPKQPAAFMGDTINVLSANWSGDPTGWGGCRNDCQSGRALSARPAVTSYVNAAFLSGVPDTVAGGNGYNGGFENYPRFHENWSPAAGQQQLWYRGSFVSLGTVEHANGPWCGTSTPCNIYNPPDRQWNYDPDFQTVDNLPPLTPRVVSVEQILFTENFR